MSSGPPVAVLVHRLAACPDDFLAAPIVGDRGVVAVAAVVGDAVRALGDELPADWVASLGPPDADAPRQNWLRACLVAAWLVVDPALTGRVTGAQVLRFLAEDLDRTAALVRTDLLVRDPDRREEVARLLLRAAGLTPGGETEAQAADRLSTLDSVHRSHVEAEARAAEARAREVRAAMERQRAEEAAARATRE